MHEDDLHRCGHPLSRSANPAMDGSYEADHEVTCYACAADQEFRKTHKDLPPGAIVRVHDTWPKGMPLPEWTPPGVDGEPDGPGEPRGEAAL